MNKLKIILTAGIAATFMLSCSNGSEDNLSSSSVGNESSSSEGRNESSSSDGSGNESSSSKGDSSNSNNGGGNNSSSSVGNESSSSDVRNESSSSRSGNNSSSSNGGDESGSFVSTEVYTLVNKDAGQFTYMETQTGYYCARGGVLGSYDDKKNIINYSINNNILTWEYELSYWDDDTLNFKGTSNQLIGTWTRTKNRDASCELYYDYGDYMFGCKDGYDITKAVFTETTVSITRDICITDGHENEGDYANGWKWRVVNCNTAEIYKGADKVTYKVDKNSEEINYNGKTCKYSEPSKFQMEAACKEAWDEHQNGSYWDDYYDEILSKDFYDCMKRVMPQGFWTEEEDDYGKVAAKPLAKAKAKIIPLLKKRN